MSPFRRALPVAGFLLALAAPVSPADEVSDKQRKVAEANLKKADIAKMVTVETDNLIVCAPLTETRAKTVAETAQKTFKVARKALQYDEKEEPWKGKLTVYYLPERQNFTQFMRLVVGLRVETTSHVAIRGDEPYVVSGAEISAKATDADIAAELGPLVGGALLSSKAGPANPIPGWVRNGFGRAASVRADGPNGKRFAGYKAQARIAVLGGAGKPPAPVAEAWGDRPDADLIATSLMDYLAFGPEGKNFPKFVSALRLNENGEPPTAAMVFENAMLKQNTLDAAWKKWVQGGMVVKSGQ
ncbi:MAG: hypothetical protein JWO38_4783 [Gemmataceae bacterium]|nr:hypothetical protein [Gemmataceae bacterium]